MCVCVLEQNHKEIYRALRCFGSDLSHLQTPPPAPHLHADVQTRGLGLAGPLPQRLGQSSQSPALTLSLASPNDRRLKPQRTKTRLLCCFFQAFPLVPEDRSMHSAHCGLCLRQMRWPLCWPWRFTLRLRDEAPDLLPVLSPGV